MFRTIALAAAATLALGLGTAAAQDYTLDPINGANKLAAGFTPDPLVVDVQAGGDLDAFPATACGGYIVAAPAYRLFYTAGDAPLAFSVTADADTTLIISDPEGNWVCNDDTNGLNPEVVFATPLDGQYDIWVGTYSKGGPITVPLTITGTTGAATTGGLDYNLDPVNGTIDLLTGFTPDPNVTEITAGGPVDIGQSPDIGDACWGFATAEPTLRLNYTAGSSFPLYIYALAAADDDLVLAVNNPDGTWFCDDDSAGNLNPLVTFDAPVTGQYDIWVGTYSDIGGAPATLYISEVNAGPGEEANAGNGLNWDLEPLFGRNDALPPGFGTETVEVEAGGTVSPMDVGDNCVGYVTAAPSYRIYYEGTAPLTFAVAANGADTTLVVADPEGLYVCSDDANGTFDPEIVFDPGYAGQYDIWVGTFATDGTTVPATLTITEGEAVATLNWDLEPTYGATEFGVGVGQEPLTIAVDAGGDIDAFAALPEQACNGFVTTQPTYRISYLSSGRSLTFAVTADADTTLVIADPAGDWFCNDDFDGANPAITFDAPADGPFDVWVGTYTGPGQVAPATLTITEGGEATNPPVETTALDPTLEPTAGTTALTAGFVNDPFTVEVAAGGDVQAYLALPDDSCFGYLTVAPTYVLSYTAGEYPLTIKATSENDTTLVILAPDGTFHCNDDTDGLNPEVTFATPETGAYVIWVGTYGGEGITSPATLAITELGGTVETITQLDWALDPVAGTGALEAGFTPDPFTVEVNAGGDFDAYEGTGEEACWGRVTVGPTYRLNYTGTAPLGFLVQSDLDTVLVISDPDGNWVCSDDEGGNFNPAVFFETPAAGQYDIWVGTFGGETGPATLTITATDPVAGMEPVPSPPVPTEPAPTEPTAAIDPAATPGFGEATINAGFSPDPTTVDITAGGTIDAATVDGACNGFITAEPTYRLTYAAASWPLILSAVSEADLTIVVRTPDGTFLCNDDTNGANPAVRIEQPAAGAYEIWVGTYAPGPAQAGTLFISEISAGP